MTSQHLAHIAMLAVAPQETHSKWPIIFRLFRVPSTALQEQSRDYNRPRARHEVNGRTLSRPFAGCLLQSRQLLRVLAKLAKKSSNQQLQDAFTTHREETEGHIERLEKVFETIGKKPRPRTCDAILGIIA
jgi:hypothetical protein